MKRDIACGLRDRKFFLSKRTFIIGSQAAYSLELAEIILELGRPKPTLVDNLDPDQRAALAEEVRVGNPGKLTYFAAPGVPGIRKIISLWAKEIGLEPAVALTHQTASISQSAQLRGGVTVNRLAAIAAGVHCYEHVQINRLASIGHDSVLEAFVTVGPGAVVCGSVTVRRGAYIGAGSVLTPGVTVGRDSVIGAGSIVLGDVPDCTTWVGNPARLVKNQSTGFGGYSSVS